MMTFHHSPENLLLIIMSWMFFAGQSPLSASAADFCPGFGTESTPGQPGGNAEWRSGIILNLESPARCNGTVTAWSYCFHRPQSSNNDDNEEIHSATFAVFRRSAADRFIALPDSVFTVALSRREIGDQDSFQCRNEVVLPNERRFQIRENDVVGACLSGERAGEGPLHMVSNMGGDVQVYYDDSDACGSAVNSVEFSELRRMRSWRLHLQAHIGPLESNQCTLGNNPAPTSFLALPWEATLLNTQHPASCSNSITAWQLCYYTSNEAIEKGERTYRATIGVWRMSNSSNRAYFRVNGSEHEISLRLRRKKDPEPALCCLTRRLQRPLFVQSGDIVGVSIPAEEPIPLFANGAVGSGNSLQVLSSGQNLSHSLHIYAIVGLESSRANVVTTAIVVITCVAAVLAVVAVVLLAYCWKRKRNTIKTVDTALAVHYKPSKPRTLYVKQSGGGSKRHLIAESPENPSDVSLAKVSSRQTKHQQGEVSKPREKQARHKPEKQVGKQQLLSKNDGRANLAPEAVVASKPRSPLLMPKKMQAAVEKSGGNGGGREGSTRYEMSSGLCSEALDGEGYFLLEAEYSILLKQNFEDDIYRNVDIYKDPASDKDSLYAQLQGWSITRISRGAIRGLRHLGSGQFGKVELGEWDDGTKKIPVALKTLNKDSSPEDTVKFLQEAAIMAQFHHPNVINLHGVVIIGEPVVLVVELADGDLLNHLYSINDGTFEDLSKLLLRFSLQVGLGMQYLSAKGFVHRDLATRNILIKKAGRICKIADFGMSRDLANEEIYVSSGGKIPLKWTAPEAIQYGQYSTASDVWSYGCVLYEIWSLGSKPFGFEKNDKVMTFLKSGLRLSPPPGCPRVVYETMIKSWHPNPDDRPTFRDILNFLSNKAEVLVIPLRDLKTHARAGCLGAELEAGLLMYGDLQQRYKKPA